MTFRELREKSGLNQTELAERSGVQQVTISQLELGKVTDPRYSTVKALADALGVTAAVVAKSIAETAKEAAA